MLFDTGPLPHKECSTAWKWSSEERYASGEPPDETVLICSYYDGEGNEVTDEDGIAALEANFARAAALAAGTPQEGEGGG